MARSPIEAVTGAFAEPFASIAFVRLVYGSHDRPPGPPDRSEALNESALDQIVKIGGLRILQRLEKDVLDWSIPFARIVTIARFVKMVMSDDSRKNSNFS
jgi:hypothetical protein